MLTIIIETLFFGYLVIGLCCYFYAIKDVINEVQRGNKDFHSALEQVKGLVGEKAALFLFHTVGTICLSVLIITWPKYVYDNWKV